MKVPAFLLRRLYVRGSLRNTDSGWAFTLNNSIAGGEATGLEPLIVDGRAMTAGQCFFIHEGEPISFDQVSEERRFGLQSGRDIVIAVNGHPLALGTHTVEMAFEVPGIGRLAFDFSDEVA
ncbi:MAG: hypothetical protein ACE5MI_02875 [Acidimicrobiia bacterium]